MSKMNTPEKFNNTLENVHCIALHNPCDLSNVVRGLSALGGWELVSTNPRGTPIFSRVESMVKPVVVGNIDEVCYILNRDRNKLFQTRFLSTAQFHVREKAEEVAVEAAAAWFAAVEENLLAQWKCWSMVTGTPRRKLVKGIKRGVETLTSLAGTYSDVIEMEGLGKLLEERQQYVRYDLEIFDPVLCNINSFFSKMLEKNWEAEKRESVFE